MNEALQHKTILLFDGYCNFCSNAVQFILKHEKNNALFFASLQSETGIELLNHYHIDPAKTDSLVLIENSKAYVKSSAALKVSTYLKGLYPALLAFMIIPSFIRNWVYDFIARNRYKWFGKSDSCMLPAPSVKQRFLSV
jgi:predicted DCC family thiol-disulfide oxidoreductase YuxK